MTLLFDELFTCPNCQIIFQSKVIGSFDTFGKNYSDFYIGSRSDPQPILYEINICPKCGMSFYSLDYKTFSENLEQVRTAITKIAKFTKKDVSNFNPGEGYLVIANYLPNISSEEKINLYLKATYAYRELNDLNIKLVREEIISMIKNMLMKNENKIQTEEFYLYLTGELARLTNKTTMALEYFEKAIKKAEQKSLISRLVEHQLKNPKEILPQDFLKS
jgi:hypothetical protein